MEPSIAHRMMTLADVGRHQLGLLGLIIAGCCCHRGNPWDGVLAVLGDFPGYGPLLGIVPVGLGTAGVGGLCSSSISSSQ